MPPMREFLADLVQLLAGMGRQAVAVRLQQTASSLTLLTLLAVVPMAAIGLLVLKALPVFQTMRRDVERFVADHLFLPSFSQTVGGLVNEFIDSANQLSAIGMLLFLATAITAMLTIDRTLNEIWRTPRPRPLAQRLALYWGLLTLAPLAIGAALALQVDVAVRIGESSLVVAAIAAVLPGLLGMLFLVLLYRLAPNVRVRWGHALAGALLTMLLLQGLERLLTAYVARFPSYTVVYGAFAALPLLLLWLFAIWLAVLAGALLAANLRFWRVPLGAPHVVTPANDFDRVVRVLAEVVRAAPAQVPSARFRADFDGDAITADRVAGLLAAEGFLVRVWPVSVHGGPAGVWDELWLPAPGLATKTLRPVFDRIWSGTARRAERARRRGTVPIVDPGGELLGRPVGEVLAVPGDTGVAASGGMRAVEP
jgi:membrane protein